MLKTILVETTKASKIKVGVDGEGSKSEKCLLPIYFSKNGEVRGSTCDKSYRKVLSGIVILVAHFSRKLTGFHFRDSGCMISTQILRACNNDAKIEQCLNRHKDIGSWLGAKQLT